MVTGRKAKAKWSYWVIVDKNTRQPQMTDEGLVAVCFVKARAELELREWGSHEFQEIVRCEFRELPARTRR
jgi:hypothetical protein